MDLYLLDYQLQVHDIALSFVVTSFDLYGDGSSYRFQAVDYSSGYRSFFTLLFFSGIPCLVN